MRADRNPSMLAKGWAGSCQIVVPHRGVFIAGQCARRLRLWRKLLAGRKA